MVSYVIDAEFLQLCLLSKHRLYIGEMLKRGTGTFKLTVDKYRIQHNYNIFSVLSDDACIIIMYLVCAVVRTIILLYCSI